jgi:UPF0271 protein
MSNLIKERTMKLNCDMGESFGRFKLGNDAGVIPHIHMANIACGFHAGDHNVMEETVLAAKKHGVEIGAHPSYPDLQGFGRRDMGVSADEIRRMVIYQAGALDAFCRAAGTSLSYVKAHGAMANKVMIDNDLFTGVLKAVADYNRDLKLMVQGTPRWQEHQALASEYGVSLIWEGFADRAYEEDGSLRNRRLSGAVLSGEEILNRVESLCQNNPIVAVSGKELQFPIDSLCVHGDTEAGVNQIAQIRELLDKANSSRVG